MLVKFLKDYNGYQKKGEILEMGEPLARLLVSEKIVEIIKNKKNETISNDRNSKELQKV